MGDNSGLTGRAVVYGLLVGSLLCAACLYLGLKTAFVDSGNVSASILGFALGRAFFVWGGRYTVHENQITHSIAAMMAGVPSTAGLLGVLPGLTLLGVDWNPIAAVAWTIPVALLGIMLAVWWRKSLFADPELTFPTGVATAELISAMHVNARTGLAKAMTLGVTALIAATLCAVRDFKQWFSAVWCPSGQLAGRSLESLTIGVANMPMLLGAGALVGVPVAFAALLGSLIAWIGCVPNFVAAGADYATVMSWIQWPGAALLLASSLPSLLTSMMQTSKSPRNIPLFSRDPFSTTSLFFTLAICLATVPLSWWMFGSSWWLSLLNLIFVALGTLICARATGATDFAPYGVIGQMTQLGAGAVGIPASAAVGMSANVGGVAVQTASSLWAFRTGERLGTGFKSQLVGQLVGVLAGTALSFALYAIITQSATIGSEELPVVAAQTTQATALLSTSSGFIPLSATWAGALALLVGFVIMLSPGRKWISVAGMGVGFLLPVYYTVTMLLGASIAWFVSRKFPRKSHLVEAGGAGAIVGETLIGVGVPVGQWLAGAARSLWFTVF